MQILLSFINGILGGIGRRWFGSDLTHWFWSSRGVQTAYLMCCEAWVFWPKEYTWKHILLSVVLVAWVQFQYWSRGHGAPADIGRDIEPSADTIRRYKERWYHWVCDWLIPREHWYGFLYDFLYMALRYCCPMIGVSLILQIGSYFDLCAPCWWWPVLGIAEAGIYAFGQTLYERETWLFQTGRWWFVRGWDFSELAGGFNTFASGYLLWRLV